jgi:hypothetical protein
VHCLRHREPYRNFLILAMQNGEGQSQIVPHPLSHLCLGPLRYLSLILPSLTLSLHLPPPRVRVTAVLEARKLVDANASLVHQAANKACVGSASSPS